MANSEGNLVKWGVAEASGTGRKEVRKFPGKVGGKQVGET